MTLRYTVESIPGRLALEEFVQANDYDMLAEQYASYREAASASIGADLNEQAIERIAQLEAALRFYATKLGASKTCDPNAVIIDGGKRARDALGSSAETDRKERE